MDLVMKEQQTLSEIQKEIEKKYPARLGQLVCKLLSVEPTKRPTAKDSLKYIKEMIQSANSNSLPASLIPKGQKKEEKKIQPKQPISKASINRSVQSKSINKKEVESVSSKSNASYNRPEMKNNISNIKEEKKIPPKPRAFNRLWFDIIDQG
jgi:serine/threonine protein kinase